MEKKIEDKVIDGFQISSIINPIENTTFKFICGDLEMIRLESNGNIFVKGKLIENDMEVIVALKDYLKRNIVK